MDNGISNMEVINNLYKVSFSGTECFLREGERTVCWQFFPGVFLLREGKELGPLLVKEVQSTTDFEKITGNIKTYLILIAKIQERELVMKEERKIPEVMS